MEIRRIVSQSFKIDTTVPPGFSHGQLLNDPQSISNLGYAYPSTGPRLLPKPRTYAQDRIVQRRRSARQARKAEAEKKSNTFLVVLPGAATPKTPHGPLRGLPQSHAVKYSGGFFHEETTHALFSAVSTSNTLSNAAAECFDRNGPTKHVSRHVKGTTKEGQRLRTTKIEPTTIEPFQASLPTAPSVLSESILSAQIQNSQAASINAASASKRESQTSYPTRPRVYSRAQTSHDRPRASLKFDDRSNADLESLTTSKVAVVPALELGESDNGEAPPPASFRPLPQPRQDIRNLGTNAKFHRAIARSSESCAQALKSTRAHFRVSVFPARKPLQGYRESAADKARSLAIGARRTRSAPAGQRRGLEWPKRREIARPRSGRSGNSSLVNTYRSMSTPSDLQSARSGIGASSEDGSGGNGEFQYKFWEASDYTSAPLEIQALMATRYAKNETFWNLTHEEERYLKTTMTRQARMERSESAPILDKRSKAKSLKRRRRKPRRKQPPKTSKPESVKQSAARSAESADTKAQKTRKSARKTLKKKSKGAPGLAKCSSSSQIDLGTLNDYVKPHPQYAVRKSWSAKTLKPWNGGPGYSEEPRSSAPDRERLMKGSPSRQALIYRHCRNLEKVLVKKEIKAMKLGEFGDEIGANGSHFSAQLHESAELRNHYFDMPFAARDGMAGGEHFLVTDVADELLTTRSRLKRRSLCASHSSRERGGSTSASSRTRLFPEQQVSTPLSGARLCMNVGSIKLQERPTDATEARQQSYTWIPPGGARPWTAPDLLTNDADSPYHDPGLVQRSVFKQRRNYMHFGINSRPSTAALLDTTPSDGALSALNFSRTNFAQRNETQMQKTVAQFSAQCRAGTFPTKYVNPNRDSKTTRTRAQSREKSRPWRLGSEIGVDGIGGVEESDTARERVDERLRRAQARRLEQEKSTRSTQRDRLAARSAEQDRAPSPSGSRPKITRPPSLKFVTGLNRFRYGAKSILCGIMLRNEFMLRALAENARKSDVCAKLPKKQIDQLVKIFKHMDHNGDGDVDLDEATQFNQFMGQTSLEEARSDAMSFFAAADENNDKMLSRREWLNLWSQVVGKFGAEQLNDFLAQYKEACKRERDTRLGISQ